MSSSLSLSRCLARCNTFSRKSRESWSISTRSLHLAPPFLVDEPYINRLSLLPQEEWSKKLQTAQAQLLDCTACPRKCHVNRYEKPGVCLVGSDMPTSVVAPHFGEEATLQGNMGSGTVFFSGCNLKCSFCQNHEISHRVQGYPLTPDEIADWCIRLQDHGCHNINFVTPEHLVPQLVIALSKAKDLGLKVPVIYNSSAYDCAESLAMLEGLIDIYLPDFKVWTEASAARYLKAKDYPQVAKEAITEMQRQVGDLKFAPNGLAKSGVLIRHLVMPGLLDESKEIVKWIANLSRDSYLHIMAQYKPDANVGKQDKTRIRYEEINRPTSKEEVEQVYKYAKELGLWRFEEPARHDGFNFIGE